MAPVISHVFLYIFAREICARLAKIDPFTHAQCCSLFCTIDNYLQTDTLTLEDLCIF